MFMAAVLVTVAMFTFSFVLGLCFVAVKQSDDYSCQRCKQYLWQD